MSGRPFVVAVPTTGGTAFVGPFPTEAAAEGYRVTITRPGGVVAGARVVSLLSPGVMAQAVERAAPADISSLEIVRDTAGIAGVPSQSNPTW